jgi:uncharacterized protein (UPF0335 family)
MIDFDKVWRPVKSVIKYRHLDYDEAVTIGGQFGMLKEEIIRLEEENERLRQQLKHK